jgi:hypothetical protein
MSAISKAIRKQYRGLWRVDRALENDRLRAGLPIRHSPSARPLGNSTQKTRHGLYSRSPAAREVAAALNLRIGSPISRYSRAIDLILFILPDRPLTGVWVVWRHKTPSPGKKGQEKTMNHSMHSVDRKTHLKIVVVGLLCATLVAMVGTFARVSDIDLGTAPLVKAGQSTALSGRLPAIR